MVGGVIDWLEQISSTYNNMNDVYGHSYIWFACEFFLENLKL